MFLEYKTLEFTRFPGFIYFKYGDVYPSYPLIIIFFLQPEIPAVTGKNMLFAMV